MGKNKHKSSNKKQAQHHKGTTHRQLMSPGVPLFTRTIVLKDSVEVRGS
jgi:hypothetical protein